MSQPEPVDHPLSIWIVNPLDDIPGEHLPPQRAWSLARLLASRGHEVTWWTATWSHRRKAIRSAPLGVQDDEGFAVRLVAVRPYDRDLSLARFASHRDFGRTFERLANESIAAGQLARPDIILASLPPLDGPEAAARLAARLDAELVVDLGNVWPDSLEAYVPGPVLLRPFTRRLLLGSMARRRDAILASADAIAASSQACIDTLPTAARADVPKHVALFGGYPQQFPPPPRIIDHVPGAETLLPLPHAASPKGHPLACVHAGQLGPDEDLDTLVVAVRQLSAAGIEATIHIAGKGHREAALRAAAAAATGSCRIVVYGLLERAAHVDLLARCDVGLVLTKPESVTAIPAEAFDYAAAGLALVSGLPGELEHLIGETEAGLAYASGDPTSLARAIRTLAENRLQLATCRQAARHLAETVFDREKITIVYADWLQGLRTGAAADVT
jgi:glycosyltransferase involved in cell wall biosynthesis